jgi:hypothetical protein
MMNAGIFLVPTVHKIAIAAELAIAARTPEEPDAHALTDRPALDAGTKRVDSPDELVAWDARPIDGELALYRAGIRMTYPARLDTNPDLPRRGPRQLPLHHFQAAGLARLYCAIGLCHDRLLRFENGLLPSMGALSLLGFSFPIHPHAYVLRAMHDLYPLGLTRYQEPNHLYVHDSYLVQVQN